MESLVAVTGAEGFIGSHLVEELVQQGHRVRAMVQYNSFASHGWLDALPDDVAAQVTPVLGDVRDPRSVREVMAGAEVVYHLAALIGIPYSYVAPQSYVDTNVSGTLNVLEAARQLATPRVVHTSTSETYGTARTVPIDESHPTQAQSPYSATKAAADRLAESYHLSFETPVATVRPFNTYGPRQSARAVIPTIAAQLASGRRELALGDLTPTRDLTYVADTARAFVAVGTAPADRVVGEVLNVGSGREISIGDLALLIAEIVGADDVRIVADAARLRPPASEVQRLCCDASKLRAATGWAPRHTLRDGLTATVAWFADPANLARYRPTTYTV